MEGRSMWPLLREGDWIHVRPAPPEALRPGDIVMLLEPGEASRKPGAGGAAGRWVVHRLWWTGARRGGRRLWTRGDWSDEWDSPALVPFGVVTRIERGDRKLAWEGARPFAGGLALLACARTLRAGVRLAGAARRTLFQPCLAWSVRGFGPARRGVRRLLLPWPARLDAWRDALARAADSFGAGLWRLLLDGK